MANKRSGGGLSATQQAAKFLGVSVLAGAVAAGIALPAVGGLGLVAKGTAEGFEDIPAVMKRPPLSQKTRILDAEGGLIADVYYRNRSVVPLEDISPWMRKAIIAIEDARFYQHGAVDLKGVLRALNRNAQSGEVSEGASTLTQQYVKNVFVEEAGNDPDKVAQATQQTIGRKIKELKYAIQLEQEHSKDQILENYLNITFFGQQSYGVEAASQRYFSKSAKELEVQEAALLAGLVQSPSRYDPLNDEQEALERRNVVLTRMAATGAIERDRLAELKEKPLGLEVSRQQNGCITASRDAGFFCDYVRQQFLNDEAFGKTDTERQDRWRRGGLTIRTTLSPKAQKAASEAAKSKVHKTDKVAAAVVSVEPGTGRIVAMTQTRPYGNDAEKNETSLNFSVETAMGGSSMGFQPGSTFKPVVAAAALEKGVTPAHTYRSRSKTKFDQADFTTCENKPYGSGPYPVQNERDDMSGTWDMYSGLGDSVNTYAIDLLRKTGLCETADMATKLGIRNANGKQVPAMPSMGLGVVQTTPLAMANAYATFANRGEYCTPVAIESVTDAQGNKLKPPRTECSRAMSEQNADMLNQLLKGVMEEGTGAGVKLSGRESAGKTGTTEERKDVWFAGYTPELSTAVWVGGDGVSRPKMYDVTIGGQYYPTVSGSGLPGPIWRATMTGALQGVEAGKFNPVKVPRGGKKDKDKDKDDKRDEDGDSDDNRPPNSPELPWPPPGFIGGGDNAGTTGGDTGGPGGDTGGDSVGPGGWTTGGDSGDPGWPPPR